MLDSVLDVEKARNIAESFVKTQSHKLGNRFEELVAERLVPNKSINSTEYWEFWLVQEDSRLQNTNFAKSVGVNLADLLTYADNPPSILLSKLRVSKVNGNIEVINWP